MNKLIKIGCNKCKKYGIVPEKSPHLAMCGMNVPMFPTLSLLSKTCPFCDSEIVHSLATREDIDKYSKSIEAGLAINLYNLKEIIHIGKVQ